MDERYGRSIELSYEELKKTIVDCGFEMQEEKRICTPYTDNVLEVGCGLRSRLSMMTTLFRGVMFVAKKA